MYLCKREFVGNKKQSSVSGTDEVVQTIVECKDNFSSSIAGVAE